MPAAVLFQLAAANAVYNERVAIILGLTALFLALLAFVSCRTCLAWLSRLGWKHALDNRVYRQFYRFHSYYWWFLGAALVAHIFMAVVHTGLPESGDPDAYIHWRILGFGLGGAVVISSVFVSCRLCLKYFTRSLTSGGGRFGFFARFHTYYWAIFLIVVALHFFLAFSHAGIWPPG